MYELYFAAAKLLLHESAMRPTDIEGADRFPLYVGMRYRFGRDDTVYYKLRSVAPDADGSVPSIEYDRAPWGEIRGIPITKAQHERMSCRLSPLAKLMDAHGLSPEEAARYYREHPGFAPPEWVAPGENPVCYPFLRESDPDLTPVQRAYVKAHPLTLNDFRAIIQQLGQDNPWK